MSALAACAQTYAPVDGAGAGRGPLGVEGAKHMTGYIAELKRRIWRCVDDEKVRMGGGFVYR